ncbi:hypothetical protein NMY22_g17973 [Coprinellus aureogranulatus]|nr:hypothetical protein NMY22_g17973 [Coprinellus aureogranulatus]
MEVRLIGLKREEVHDTLPQTNGPPVLPPPSSKSSSSSSAVRTIDASTGTKVVDTPRRPAVPIPIPKPHSTPNGSTNTTIHGARAGAQDVRRSTGASLSAAKVSSNPLDFSCSLAIH